MAKGAGIGGMLGTAFGSMFGPVGSAIGGAGGKIIGGIGDAIAGKKKDDLYGPTAQQTVRSSQANQTLTQEKNREGMSSGTVQRAQESQNRDIVNENKTLNTLQQNPQMSSLAQEQMGRALVKDITKAHALNREKIMEADLAEERHKIDRVGKAEDRATSADNAVKKAEMVQQGREDARSKAMIGSAAGAIGTVGKAFDIETDNKGILNNFGKKKSEFDNDWTQDEMDNASVSDNQGEFDNDWTQDEMDNASAFDKYFGDDSKGMDTTNSIMDSIVQKSGDQTLIKLQSKMSNLNKAEAELKQSKQEEDKWQTKIDSDMDDWETAPEADVIDMDISIDEYDDLFKI